MAFPPYGGKAVRDNGIRVSRRERMGYKSMRRIRSHGRFGVARSILAMLTVIVMCVGMMPVTVFAAGETVMMDSWSNDESISIDGGQASVSGSSNFMMASVSSGTQYAVCYWAQNVETGLPELDRTVDSDGNEILVDYRMDKTRSRNLKMDVVVDFGNFSVSGDSVPVEIVLPYSLEIGRDGKNNPTMVAGSPDGFTRVDDKTANTVTFTNDAFGADQGERKTFTVTYKADCWYVESKKTVSPAYSISVGGNVVSGQLTPVCVTTGVDLTNTYNMMPGVVFGDVDYSSAYAKGYHPRYGTYFGLSEDQFLEDKANGYVYDVCMVRVQPYGQQPYDVTGCTMASWT